MDYRSSIVIPSYNQSPQLLREAIQSALFQTEPTQVVVVDDGSKEPIATFVQNLGDLAGLSDRLLCITKPNGGVASALNAGIAASNGKYIQWLSSDDLLMETKSEKQCNLLESTGGMVSYGGFEDGVPTPTATYGAPQFPSQELFFGALRKHCFVYACAVMWRRTVFDEIGWFKLNMRHCQDYEFLLRCAERWNFDAINEPLARRRVHQGQMSNLLKQQQEAIYKAEELDFLHNRYGSTAGLWVPS